MKNRKIHEYCFSQKIIEENCELLDQMVIALLHFYFDVRNSFQSFSWAQANVNDDSSY